MLSSLVTHLLTFFWLSYSPYDVVWTWGQILDLDFAYISRKFPSDPRFVSENEETSAPPPRLIDDWNIQIL
jgi:hypothetical protein